MSKRWLRLAACCLLALAALAPGRPAAAAQPSPLQWAQITPLDPAADLADVALVSQGEAWLIGNKYDVPTGRQHGVLYRLRRESGAWRGETGLKFEVPLHDIDANGPADIWVVGDYGRLILRYDGTGWRESAGVADQPRDQALTVIDMAPGGAEGWLAGGVKTSSSGSMGPRLYHFAGGAWSREAAVAGDVEGGIRALSVTPNAVWAFGGTAVWRRANGRWATERIARENCPVGVPCFEQVIHGQALDDQTAWALPFADPLRPALLRRDGAGWRREAMAPPPPTELPGIFLERLAFSDPGHGWAVGWTQPQNHPVLLRYEDGVWGYAGMPIPNGSYVATAVSAFDADHAMAVGNKGLIMAYGYGPEPGGDFCFAQTGECVNPRFAPYWEANGGLPVFGYPLGPAASEFNRDAKRLVLTQHFERNRLEHHPENAGTPYEILLGLLGKERLAQLGRDWSRHRREAGPQAGCLWFEETGHNVCDQQGGLGFKSYWQSHGLNVPGLDPAARSLQLFGMPLTEAAIETNANGDTVLTQWFERARFEWHPANPDQFKVLLGLLDKEMQARR